MCGIAGFIGRTKNKDVTNELISKLFYKLNIRGIDASGFWATECGDDGRILYHKEPMKSDMFVEQNQYWKLTESLDIDCMLVHARATSKSGGKASDNKNNHPFTSKDFNTGMVHNGNLEEFKILKNNYQIKSDTDSECILRMYENGKSKLVMDSFSENMETQRNILGVTEIFENISVGAMAVAIAEKLEDGRRSLILFRNSKRPLWLADLRETLGQVFFFSTPEIWNAAIYDSKKLSNLNWPDFPIIEMKTEQMWQFIIDKENPYASDDKLSVFDFNLVPTDVKLEAIDEAIGIKDKNRPFKLITGLNHEGNVSDKEPPEIPEISSESIDENTTKIQSMLFDLVKKINENNNTDTLSNVKILGLDARLKSLSRNLEDLYKYLE